MPGWLETHARLLPLSASRLTSGVPLFCVPSAGASAAIFRDWCGRGAAPRHAVTVHPVELPGRGTRRSDPLASDLPAIVRQLARELGPLLHAPFALFGHSFGAMVCFELAAHATGEGHSPVHLFLSGCRAPDAGRGTPLHAMDDERLLASLAALGGIPDVVLADRDLMLFLLPVIRRDLERLETHDAGRPGPVLSCPVDALAGSDDPSAPPEDMEGWRAVTRGPFRLERFAGGHFFLEDPHHDVLAVVRARLHESLIARGAS